MADRYFAAEPVHGESVVLSGPEAQHLSKVMRAKPGDEVVVFDGTGREFVARVERLTRGEVQLAILQQAEVDRELGIRLTLGVALPKGDRQKWLVEKAVELGVTRLVPLETSRGVAQPTAGALDRLRRSVIEASKQCGRNRLLEIAEAEPVDAILSGVSMGAARLLAHPGGAALSTIDFQTSAAGVYCLVGPEGGFTDDEVQRATSAGWQPVSLGERILRIETAAIAMAAYVAIAGTKLA
jgi:16S rRNA (uracil1498-N3)-methyltransferase